MGEAVVEGVEVAYSTGAEAIVVAALGFVVVVSAEPSYSVDSAAAGLYCC